MKAIVIIKGLIAVFIVTTIKGLVALYYPQLYTNLYLIVLIDLTAYIPAMLIFGRSSKSILSQKLGLVNWLVVPVITFFYFVLVFYLKVVEDYGFSFETMADYVERFHVLPVQLRMHFLSILLSGPVLEEYLFRWLILKSLMQNFPKWTSVIVSSLLFLLVHVYADISLVELISVFFLGIILSIELLKTNNLIWCIYIHIWFNLMNYIIWCLSNLNW